MAFYVAMAVAVGAIMAKLVEIPMLSLRDRLFPARASITATAGHSSSPFPGQ
jgi:hypothetical protein